MTTERDFERIVTKLVAPNGPGVAVAVRQAGQLVHAGGYGLANVEWNVPIGLDTVFRIGSVTKQFTAAAILRLREAGKLQIDDPIETHLPDYPIGGSRITIRHLLNHTSGIKSLTSLDNFATELVTVDRPLNDLIALFQNLPLDFTPGELSLYNNSGYLLLGAIIEAASGTDYGAYLQETFFGPLGLTSTTYLHDWSITPRRAAGYDTVPSLAHASPISMSVPHAAGALGSTVEDLLRWNQALHGGEVVSPEDYAAMITPGKLRNGQPTPYGFGLILGSYRGKRHIGHNGGINGFQSGLTYWPDDDLTVAVLSNVSSFAVEQVTYGLARRALGLSDTSRTPTVLSAENLQACAGVFRFGLGPLRLAPCEAGLEGDWPAPRSRFLPVSEETFYLEGDPEIALKFEDARDGAFSKLSILGYGDPAVAWRTSAAQGARR